MQWPSFRSKGSAPTNSDGAKVSTIAVSWNRDGAHDLAEPARDSWLSDAGSFGADAELADAAGAVGGGGFRRAGRCRHQARLARLLSPGRFSRARIKRRRIEAAAREPWRPALSSKETLIDEGFAVSIAGWLDPSGQRPQGNVAIDGAVIKAGNRVSLLPESAWRVVESVAQFWARPPSERVADSNRRAWSAIRSHAASASADMTDFLRKTVVLTPERLRIDMRKGDVGGANMVEVQPGFDGAPERWLEIFDRLHEVPERDDIPDGNGIVHVMLAPEVRTVLREIRKMPGRRIAGDRAEAFLRNPFATLGPDASKVIDPAQFEKARDDAGVSFARFTARALRDEKGYPYDCALLVEETIHGEVRSRNEPASKARRTWRNSSSRSRPRIAASAQCCHWRGYDLEILGDTPDQAEIAAPGLARHVGPRWCGLGDFRPHEVFRTRRGLRRRKPGLLPLHCPQERRRGVVPRERRFRPLLHARGGWRNSRRGA